MTRPLWILSLACLLSVPALARTPASATFTVTNTNDSGAGSLRQAILDCNLTAAVDAIVFNIGAGGLQTITPLTPFPTCSDPVSIDATTQPGYAGTPLIELDGVTAGSVGLFLNATATVKGLAINRFTEGIRLDGYGSLVQSCYIGVAPDGVTARGNIQAGINVRNEFAQIGGSGAGQGNVISGTTTGPGIMGFGGGYIQGNRIGTNAAGTSAIPNQTGIWVNPSQFYTIGGAAAGEGNLISGNTFAGVRHDPNPPGSVFIYGNRIGTNAAGTAAIPNGEGVRTFTDTTSVGGFLAGQGNVISGNTQSGVVLIGNTATVHNNLIGRTLGNAGPLPNGARGIHVFFGDGHWIDSNVIAHNGGAGVEIQAGRSIRILKNAIFSNGAQGIVLGGNPPNDTLDTDIGPNDFQNYPVLDSAITTGGANTVVSGHMQTTPNMTLRLEFFDSAAADPSGFGEGEIFRHFTGVTSDVNGILFFTTILPASLPVGRFISATATDAFNNTSGFSQVVAVKGEGNPPVVTVTTPSAPTSGTAVSLMPMAGTVTDDVGATSLSWSGPAGSGPGTVVGTDWTTIVALQPGENEITIHAFDAAGNEGTATVSVFYDGTPPAVAITIPVATPTYTSKSTPLSVWGTASDDLEIDSITWTNSAGGSGTAIGGEVWAAAVPLEKGENIITVTATDRGGNTATATLTVDYKPGGGTSGSGGCGALGAEAAAVVLLALAFRNQRRVLKQSLQ